MIVTSLTTAQAERAAEIPGCSRYGTAWKIPPDCTSLIGVADKAADERSIGIAWRAADVLVACGVWDRLWPDQRDDVTFLLAHGGGLIAHPTAAGKAVIGSACARVLAPEGPVLIVCPALARGVWRAELAKWYEGQVTELEGLTPPGPVRASGVVVISMECISPAWAKALVGNQWAGFIIDELHGFRGRRTRRAKGLRPILSLSGGAVRIGLSATPQWGRVDSLYNVLDPLRPGWFGGYTRFTERYAGAMEDFWGSWEIGRATNDEELRQRLAFTVRRLPKSRLRPNLPPLVRRRIPIANPKAAARLAKAALAVTAMQRAGASPGACLQQMHKALCAATKAKLAALPLMLEGADRVFIATQTHDGIRQTTDAIMALNRAEGPNGQVWTIFEVSGEVPIPQRIKHIAHAVSCPPPVVIVGTMQSVAQAIDGTGIDVWVALELPPTGVELEQWEGRGHRHHGIEARYPVIEHSIDERFAQLCIEKLEDAQKTVGIDPLTVDLLGVLGGVEDTSAQVRRLGL